METESSYICIKCKSRNVEELADQTLFCCDCSLIFTVENYNMCKKTLYKMLSCQTGEDSLQDIITDSINHIYDLGILLYPQIHTDLKNSIRTGQPLSVVAAKLSMLEIFAETSKKIKK